ncbi:hypothetical protein [Clostridium sp. C8-1-8]|uniref:hypothetical protein n=1 Tax=Clostridium sp. C8-1-8 TaxID=2698831 RepID=UPI0013707C6B|nr:hypothetical protein [Clostridium sp. C8-1-8]
MSKLTKIAIVGLITFILSVIGIAKFSFNSGYKISINNTTNVAIERLELKYKAGNVIKAISQIGAKASWTGAIDTNSFDGENAIILTYKDNKNNPHEEYVVGYLEKGYHGNTNVVINNIDENGKLELEVK